MSDKYTPTTEALRYWWSHRGRGVVEMGDYKDGFDEE